MVEQFQQVKDNPKVKCYAISKSLKLGYVYFSLADYKINK